MPHFTSEKQPDGGRIGTLETRRGVLKTPFFMPDATRAAVRGTMTDEVRAAGIGALVVNTYHLMLSPGADLIAKAGPARHASPGDAGGPARHTSQSDVGGGIHSFMHWDGPILSDSGGYQVYSLIHRHPEMGRITEEGAEFKSVLDGTKYLLTPERSIQIQFDLGVDMMVCLDDPRPNEAAPEEIAAAVERTTRFAVRCKAEYEKQVAERGMTDETRPLLFGVVQGGTVRELRKRSAEGLAGIGFDGYGFGARHVDEEGVFLEDIVAYTASLLPEDRPRFALGVGTPEDIVRCHRLGWDMFDCVIPTREGRHGRLFVFSASSPFRKGEVSSPRDGGVRANDETITPQSVRTDSPSFRNNPSPSKTRELPFCKRGAGEQEERVSFYETLNIQNEQFREDFTPIDPTCDCPLCKNHTRAYLRHLFRVADPLAGRLATLHNLRFYARLMEGLRK